MPAFTGSLDWGRKMRVISSNRKGKTGLILVLAMLVLAACTGEPQNRPDNTDKPNTPPVVVAGSDQSLGATTTFTLAGNAIDDKQISSYLWTQVSGPNATIASPNESTTAVNIALPIRISEYRFRFTATDNEGASASDELLVTVTPDLIISAGNDQTVSSGTPVQLRVVVLSQGAPLQSYLWVHNNSSTTGTLPITSYNQQTLEFTPQVTTQTTYDFTVAVTDQDRVVATDSVQVTVNPLVSNNQPPVAVAGNDQTVTAGDTVTLDGSGSNDPDGSISTWNWSVISGNVTLQSTGVSSVQFQAPQVATTTTVTLRLTVTDNQQATSFDDVVITVTGNPPPTANAGADQTASPGQQVTIVGSGSDNGSITQYAWEQIGTPAVTLSGTTTQQVSFTAPDVTAPTSILLRLTVTDNNGATASDDVVITVNPVVTNIPPTANAGPDFSYDGGTQLSITGSGSDTDGTIAAYLWEQIGGPAVTLTNANTSRVSFVTPSSASNSTVTLRLTVTDNQGATGTDEVVISVRATQNAAPTANAGVDQSVASGPTVNLNGSGNDSDGTIASYA